MPINIYLKGPGHNQSVCVDKKNHINDKNALVVANRELYQYDPKQEFFINESFGFEMAKDFEPSGSELIHNGIDTVAWTASAISGTWTFNSNSQAHSGTKSIDATSTSDNSTAQFARGSSLTLDSDDVFEGWVYISSWPFLGGGAIEFYGWNTSTSSRVGSIVEINDYVSTGSTDIWQKFTIPANDMGLIGNTINSVRIRTQSGNFGINPDYYLDDIYRKYGSGGTGPKTYYVTPDLGSWFYINTIRFFIEDTFSPTLVNCTVPYIPYNTIFGITPDSGIVLRKHSKGEIIESTSFKSLVDILNYYHSHVETILHYDSKTSIIIDIHYPVPIILKDQLNDFMTVFLSDDFSALEKMRILVLGKQINWYEYQMKQDKPNNCWED